jgi:hypothetical protein
MATTARDEDNGEPLSPLDEVLCELILLVARIRTRNAKKREAEVNG